MTSELTSEPLTATRTASPWLWRVAVALPFLGASLVLGPTPALGQVTSTPTSPTPTAPQAAPTGQPHPRSAVDPHGPNPHGTAQGAAIPAALASGSPFDSDHHRRQAELARSGRSFHPSNATVAEPQMPAGSIGIMLRDGQRQPVRDQRVVLRIVKESIEQGNTESELETSTNDQGYAGFLQQPTTSHYRYEVVARMGGAKYSSGPFTLDERHGKLVSLYVYPTTENLSDTFIYSRALYVIHPRDDVFDIQGLYRFENTNPLTWIAKDYVIQLPPGAQAFRAGNPSGDLRASQRGDGMAISGTFSPGQHELSFSYQLPNEGSSTAQLLLPLPPHNADLKAILEASKTMTFSVAGTSSPRETRGQDGQRALMVVADYLGSGGAPPTMLRATISGLPARSWGAVIAAIIAGAVALLGIAFAASSGPGDGTKLPEQDRKQARDLLLQELLLLERAFERQQIGPKTYEQTRRQLVDAIARLELDAPAEPAEAATAPS